MPASLLGRKWTWHSRINATLALLVAAGMVAFVGVAVISNYRAAGDAVASLNQARALTARRIDKLNHQIDKLSTQNAQAARQRGRLLAEVKALTQQISSLGVTPVVAAPSGEAEPRPTMVVVRPSPHPHPTASRTTTAKPTPTHKPSPSPEPKPSCLLGITTSLTCQKKSNQTGQ